MAQFQLGRFEDAKRLIEEALAGSKGAYPPLELWRARAAAAAAAPDLARDILRAESQLFCGRYPMALETYEAAVSRGKAAGLAADQRFRATWGPCHYNIACACSRLSGGQMAPKAPAVPVAPADAASLRSRALENLRKAVALGAADAAQVRADSDFEPLKGLPEFEAFLRELGK
jgi:tetratricopeptide (TPR) repeat protein